MKLLLLSDLHLELSDLVLDPALEVDVALLAGDIVNPGHRLADWVARSPVLRRARAVVAVAGNHEYFDTVLQQEAAALRRAAAAARHPPLHWLDGDAVVIDGVRFLGCTLWTDFALRIDTPQGPRSDAARGLAVAAQRMADYWVISWRDDGPRRPLTPQDTLRLHQAQRQWLAEALAQPFDGPTVVLTHHGPHRGSLVPRFAADWVSAAYLNELPDSFFQVPRLWLHGHTHASSDYRVGGCRIVCNPRGYQPRGAPRPENPQFDPARVVVL
ncbi:MAG: metallophosphoesterase family protein [Burkholderiales bacterium]|nr:metallophosphoesterase family protein [Burkholderiales bacterium]